MKNFTRGLRRVLPAALLTAGVAAASSAMAVDVTMPTTTGPQPFDADAFASSIHSGPAGGAFGCFTGGAISPCTSASLLLAVLGPDLTMGLTLGTNAQVEIVFAKPGDRVAIWEAGNFTAAHDYQDLQVSVRTAAGWTLPHSYATEHIGRVLGDTEPSGYPTNYGTFSAADFGLAPGAHIDAVRLHAYAGGEPAHADVLAVAVVPEPDTTALLLSGLAGLGWLLRRRSL